MKYTYSTYVHNHLPTHNSISTVCRLHNNEPLQHRAESRIHTFIHTYMHFQCDLLSSSPSVFGCEVFLHIYRSAPIPYLSECEPSLAWLWWNLLGRPDRIEPLFICISVQIDVCVCKKVFLVCYFGSSYVHGGCMLALLVITHPDS